MASVKEAWPLSWPEGWPRTRPQDQKVMTAWKRTAQQYHDALAVELKRMKCPAYVISSNVPLTMRSTLNATQLDPRDVGVAVYFSRETPQNFAWQDALGLTDPVPTEEQITSAYRRLAQVHHPDRGGDIAMFQALTKHRDQAIRWVNRRESESLDYVIACDGFQRVRWNLCAITLTIRSIRQIERCGTSSLLERAFKGFSALPAHVEAAVGVR